MNFMSHSVKITYYRLLGLIITKDVSDDSWNNIIILTKPIKKTNRHFMNIGFCSCSSRELGDAGSTSYKL